METVKDHLDYIIFRFIFTGLLALKIAEFRTLLTDYFTKSPLCFAGEFSAISSKHSSPRPTSLKDKGILMNAELLDTIAFFLCCREEYYSD